MNLLVMKIDIPNSSYKLSKLGTDNLYWWFCVGVYIPPFFYVQHINQQKKYGGRSEKTMSCNNYNTSKRSLGTRSALVQSSACGLHIVFACGVISG